MSWALRNTLYASAVIVIPYIYVSWRLLISVNILFPAYARWSRRIILIAVVFFNSLPLIMLYYYANGTLLDEFVYRSQANWLDYFFLFPFWMGLILIVEVLPYYLLTDILQVTGKFFFSKLNAVVRQWSAVLRVGLVLVFTIYVALNTLYSTYNISETEFKIKINQLPQELDNLKLTLIADLQVDRFTQNYKINGVKELIKNDKTDVLFFAGDLVTRGTGFIEQGLDALCGLRANTERVAVIGDHDHWADAPKIANGLQNCGWTFLYNAHRIINHKNTRILVTGITYIYSERISRAQLRTLLKKAPQADLKILLVHQPAKIVIEAAQEFGYNIMLAGHTHGGQIVSKPFGFTLTPIIFENRFYSGYYKEKDLNIFITNGVGQTMMPLRYRAPAEVLKIVLHN